MAYVTFCDECGKAIGPNDERVTIEEAETGEWLNLHPACRDAMRHIGFANADGQLVLLPMRTRLVTQWIRTRDVKQ